MKSVPDPSPRLLKALAVVLVAGAAFSYGFVPIRASNDVWWHLKSGKIIVEAGGGLPINDVFTFTGDEIPWHNHEWLAQVLFYKLFAWGGGTADGLIGLRAVIAFKSLLIAATFLLVLLLVQQRARCLPIAALITLLALDVSRLTLYPRPPIFTYFFLAVFLVILENWRAGRIPRATVVVLPLLMPVWANLHGGFIVGLLVVLFYGIGEVAEHVLRHREGATEDEEGDLEFRSRLLWLGGTFALCIPGSLCTPYGYHLYELPLRVMGAPGLAKVIAEMKSPMVGGVSIHFATFFVMVVFVVAGLGLARAVGRKRPPVADVLVLAFFGYEALRHQRHVPLFAIVAAPILGWSIGVLMENLGRSRKRLYAMLASGLALLLAFYWIGLRHAYWNRNMRLRAGATYIDWKFPKTVCDFIVANRFEGRMFSPVNAAGYMIWRLSPETHKLFTDSRFDVFGDKFVWHEWAVRHGIDRDNWDDIDWRKVGLTEREGAHVRDLCEGAGWAEILEQWKINFIVAERDWPLCQKLLMSQQWDSVFYWIKPPYRDRRAGYEIFVRRAVENRPLIKRCRRSFEEFQRRLRL